MYHVLFVICIYIPISCIAFGIKYYYSVDREPPNWSNGSIVIVVFNVTLTDTFQHTSQLVG